MKLIQRDSDIITGKDIQHLLTFKNFPVFMGCVDTPREDDILTDMNWYISPHSGMVQLNPIVDEKTIYMKSHGSGTVGKTWNDHHKSFADFVRHRVEGDIMEIGSSHGILYDHLKDDRHKWTIVEPNYFGFRNEDVTVIPDFFNSNLQLEKKFGTILHSHMLEHVLDLKDFFESIIQHIEMNGNMIFSVPDLDYILNQNQNYVLHFEHTYLLIEHYVEEILAQYGFEIEDSYNFRKHSVFYHARYTGNVKHGFDFKGMYDYNVSQIYRTHKSINRDIEFVNSVLNSTRETCYLFGGHIFTQYLLNLGLQENNFKNILDNDSQKTGKRLYGTNLIVQKPDIIAEDKSPVVIVRAGVYADEIKNQLLSINRNCIFY